jgi:hypothetical protein
VGIENPFTSSKNRAGAPDLFVRYQRNRGGFLPMPGLARLRLIIPPGLGSPGVFLCVVFLTLHDTSTLFIFWLLMCDRCFPPTFVGCTRPSLVSFVVRPHMFSSDRTLTYTGLTISPCFRSLRRPFSHFPFISPT